MNDFNDDILSKDMEENIKTIQNMFHGDATLQLRRFQNQYSGIQYCIFFIDIMVDTNIINEDILRPILNSKIIFDDVDHISYLESHIIVASTIKISDRISDIVESILSGDTVLFVEGHSKTIMFYTKGWETRSIEEPSTERVLRGPREGFTESLATNLTLIRRRIQSKDLKFHYITLGEKTNTEVCICYIEGLVQDQVLNRVKKKISQISIDGILDVKYIQEFIDENPFSIFETSSNTERPDVVASRLLEGRLSVLVNGSPVAITAPSLFIEHMMSSDDYYLNYYFATIGRILRVLGFIATISIPALYLSLISFHFELIPTPLIMSIYAARQGVPLPSFFELFILLTVFEGLREAGARVPGVIGQSISIVGALVLGTAAVEARFVSAPMIIVVGLTAITGLSITSLSSVIIICRGLLLILSAMLGIYGYIFGILGIIIHLFNLRSFGIPFMGNLTSLRMQSLKDTAMRAPFWYMRYRPKFMSKDSRKIGGREDNE